MKTPKEYSENLKKGIITKEMLIDCLYSSNKRAKNHRDKERELRNYFRYNHYAYDKYGDVERAGEKKQEYYHQKEIMLSILQPVCIHREDAGCNRLRVYDYEPEYRKLRKEFVYENCYFDYDEQREIWFGDIETDKKYRYYLFYDLGGDHTFHSPLEEKWVKDFGLEVKDIETLYTEGHEIKDLISNQFVKKLLELIQSGEYRLTL